MTMTEIYENTDKWMKEIEETWLEEYGPDLEEAVQILDKFGKELELLLSREVEELLEAMRATAT